MKPLSPRLQRNFEKVDALCLRDTYAGRPVKIEPVVVKSSPPDALRILFGTAAPHAKRAIEVVRTPTGGKFASVALLAVGAAVFPRL